MITVIVWYLGGCHEDGLFKAGVGGDVWVSGISAKLS